MTAQTKNAGIGKMLFSAPAVAMAGGIAANAKEMAQNTGNRYDALRKALLEAPYVPGGEMPVKSAHAFIEKRAALQARVKTAAPLGGIGRQVASSGLLKKLISKEGLLIGGPLIGLGALAAPSIGQLGERIKRKIFPSTYERASMEEAGAEAFAKEVGKQLGNRSVGLLGDMLSKAVGAPSALMDSRQRQSIFNTLQQEDDVIAQADPQALLEAYHTMTRFAPTLATDKNAVKTFLRESVLYGTGPNFMAIKQLADAERAVDDTQSPVRR